MADSRVLIALFAALFSGSVLPAISPGSEASVGVIEVSGNTSGDASVGGQPTPPTAPAANGEVLGKRRAELAQRIAQLAQLANSLAGNDGQPATVAAANELRLLRSLDMILLHHQAVLADLEAARQQRERHREELLVLAASQSQKHRPKVSWLTLEETRDHLDAELSRSQLREGDIEQAHQALARAVSEVERVDRARRRVIDEAQQAGSDEQTRYEYRRRLADVEARIASGTRELRRSEWELRKTQKEAAEVHLELLREQVRQSEGYVTFSPRDLEQRRAELKQYFREIDQRLDEAQRQLREADRWCSSETVGVDLADARDATNHDATAAPVELSQETRLLVRGVRRELVLELERRANEESLILDSLQGRYRLHHRQLSDFELSEWRATCERLIEECDAESRRISTRIGELLQDLASLHRESRLKSGRASDAPTPDQPTPNASGAAAAEEARSNDALPSSAEDGLRHETNVAALRVRSQTLDSLLRTLEFSQRHIVALRRAVGRFDADLHAQMPTDVGTTHWFTQARNGLATIWNYELLAVGDQSITVSKLTRGLVGLVIGLFIAAAVSRLLGRRVLPRVGLNHGASEAMRTLSFYTLCLLFGIVSLEMANVPLTAFTFLGGAIAIGVGFGSQNILNNFISGLILLAEQPIRVGDLVEVGELQGKVERIGARSTTIRTGEHAEIIVPNSKLLEDNVTNLTRSDNHFRTSVTVGVAYGSPVEEVKQCLIRSTARPEILAEPAPFVIFADFADSTLVFELHFWVKLSSMTMCRRIESDVREAIDAEFRQSRIEMAFPQRDLHLVSARPLEIQVTRAAEARIRKAA